MDAAEVKEHVRIYVLIFVALAVLTVVTVAISYIHMPTPSAIAVAMAVAFLAVVSAPRDASAVSLNLINNWRMGNLGTLGNVNGTGGLATSTGAAGMVGSGIGSTNWVPDIGVNIHFGLGLGKGDQVVPFLGFNVDRVGVTDLDEWNSEGDSATETHTGDATMTVFGLEIGGKFFFIERAKGKAPPFFSVSFYKYFADVSAGKDNSNIFMSDYRDLAAAMPEGSTDDADQLIGYDNARHSPLGFNLGFGAEYYFNDNFSLGGEFFGIDFSWSTANNPDNIDLRDTRTSFSFYSSLTLTYRFSFSLRASVQFESDYDYED